MDVSGLAPMVTWGTNPAMGVDFDSSFPEIKDMNDERAYNYMDLEPGQKPADIELGYIFIGVLYQCSSQRFTTGCAICQREENSSQSNSNRSTRLSSCETSC